MQVGPNINIYPQIVYISNTILLVISTFQSYETSIYHFKDLCAIAFF